MAHERDDITLRRHLLNLVPEKRLRAIARETEAVQRSRKIDVVHLFWTLVLGFGAGVARSFAGLRRMYESMAGLSVVPSSFWSRFTPELATFLRRALEEALRGLVEPARAPGGKLEGFCDLVVSDATVIALHDLLEDAYPGTRTNHTPAAAKLHLVMSVHGVGPRAVKVTSERVHDGKKLPVGPWVEGRLLLFDLGYFGYRLFDRIDRNAGYFISRLKDGANPEIVEENRTWRGRAISLVGKELQEVLPRLHREVIDVDVEVTFKRRRYRGTRSTARAIFRVVGLRDAETGEYHLYITNIPREQLQPREISAAYRARWWIELVFDELKTHYGLDEIPSRKKSAVETFIYASILTLVASRRLLARFRLHCKKHRGRLSASRWATVFETYAPMILLVLLQPPRRVAWLERQIATVMAHEAIDPHVSRNHLIQQVEKGVPWDAPAS